MTRRRGRRRKKLLDDLKDRRGYSHLKEEALDLSTDRLLNNNNTYLYMFCAGLNSPVGIATRYGLEGPWIESLWGRDFQHPSIPALGLVQRPIQ